MRRLAQLHQSGATDRQATGWDAATGLYLPQTYLSEVQDEGVALTRRTKLNFTGAGVSVADDAVNSKTVVTVSGGGGSSHVIEDEGVDMTARSQLDFVGAGVTVTDDSANDRTVVTIPGGGSSDPDDGETLAGADDYNFTATSTSLPAGYSYLNSTANLTWDERNGKGNLTYAGGAFNFVRGVYRSLPGTFNTCTIRFSLVQFSTGSDDFIIFLQDSSSNKIVDLALRASGGTRLHRFNSSTSFSAESSTALAAGPLRDVYMKIVKNSSTSWDFKFGVQREVFHTLYNFNVTGFATTPDRIGFGFVTEGGGSQMASVDYIKFT